MIHHGFKVVTTAGVAVPLTSVSTPASFVTIYPRLVSSVPNAGEVRVGGKADGSSVFPPASIPSGSGMILLPGDAGVTWPSPAPGQFDLSSIYIDADTSGDGVQFIYGR